MQGYTETILKYASDDTRTGILENADGTGEVGLTGNEVGKRLAVRFTLNTDDNLIKKIRFQVFGCGFTIAACAAVSEIAEGIPLADAAHVDAWAINNRLEGLPEDRSYCAELAAEALQAAVKSADNGHQPVQTDLPTDPDHGPRITADNPVYVTLFGSPAPEQIAEEDRHLFACLFAVAAQEQGNPVKTLGLGSDDLTALHEMFFPNAPIIHHVEPNREVFPERNEEVLNIILSHLPADPTPQPSVWLAHILAARSTQPGHLWVAMGLFERPQLTAAIQRHLPTLAEANNQGMRWKRYLYKQVCDLNGGTMCKAPNCGVCSDYALCFA